VTVPDERRALTLLRLSGAAVLLLSLVMLAVFPAAPVERNVPGFVSPVVGFELAATADDVFGILGAPGDARRQAAVAAMNRGNRIDFLFMLAYPALYVGIALLVRARGRLPAALFRLLLVLPFVMWLGDLLENRELLALAGATEPAAMTDGLARLRLFTVMKWHALFGASALLAVPIWRDASWWRWCGIGFGVAAAVGFGSLLHLPLVEGAAYLLSLAWLGTWVYSLRA
jgi:hypothetical protein